MRVILTSCGKVKLIGLETTMDVLPEDFARSAKKQGRQASATVSGRRRAGFLLGNKFVFSDQAEVVWVEAGPGEFRELRLWRK
ncbi:MULTISPECIES: hypothetical protein [unclassified Thalassolituus]|nr:MULTISPECIES: hypothetical protein [unclassified Thalassolituus]MCA6060758.1 hypothetical protein [Thalassolituus sp. ST750PaO-4]TVV43586.1 hypothetical protein FOT50_07860 [Thalassolituus sp. C2-1]